MCIIIPANSPITIVSRTKLQAGKSSIESATYDMCIAHTSFKKQKEKKGEVTHLTTAQTNKCIYNIDVARDNWMPSLEKWRCIES